MGCVTCKLALHGLAPYLLNSLQRCSKAAVYRRKQRWRLLILTLRKIKHTFVIHHFLRRHLVNMHTPAALQRTSQVTYMLHKTLRSGRRRVTFCCSKPLNHTFLLSILTRPWFSTVHKTKSASATHSAALYSTGSNRQRQNFFVDSSLFCALCVQLVKCSCSWYVLSRAARAFLSQLFLVFLQTCCLLWYFGILVDLLMVFCCLLKIVDRIRLR